MRWFSILFPLLIGCGTSSGTSGISVPLGQTVTYEHKLTLSGYCADGVKVGGDPLFNCKQLATFFKDGTASMMVTDIMCVGTYTIGLGSKIIVAHFGDGEIPDPIKFEIQPTGDLVDDMWGFTWTAAD